MVEFHHAKYKKGYDIVRCYMTQVSLTDFFSAPKAHSALTTTQWLQEACIKLGVIFSDLARIQQQKTAEEGA